MSSSARRWQSALRRILLATCSSDARCAVSPERHRSDPRRLKSSHVSDTTNERTTMKIRIRTHNRRRSTTGWVRDWPARSVAELQQRPGVAPAYEGWEEGVDGVKYFLFGYMNRNWEEEIDVAVGPQNAFSPGAADLGQPTHFLRDATASFSRSAVPPNFTEKDEPVWTLTTHGNTGKGVRLLACGLKAGRCGEGVGDRERLERVL